MTNKSLFLAIVFNFLAVILLADDCTDPLAYNYNPTATADDGSCIYYSQICFGDANFDGFVDVLDLISVSSNFGNLCLL